MRGFFMTIYTILLRTFLAVIFGGLIGLERQTKQRPAGLKTHMLVCLGAMSIMLTSEMMFHKYYTEYGILLDPSRMGAQVVSGIGFLGAGTIIHTRGHVKGLTTAATLWAVGATGLVIGAGFYIFALVLSVTIFLVLITLNTFSTKMKNFGHVRDLIITLTNKPKIIGNLHLALSEIDITILDMTFVKEDEYVNQETDKEQVCLKLVLRLNNNTKYEDVLFSIYAVEGILGIE
jgi:putative Mg2+ transporter-C (MgtC) family protein